MKTRSRFKLCPNLHGITNQGFSHRAYYSAVMEYLRKFAGIFRHSANVALIQGAHEHEAKRLRS